MAIAPALVACARRAPAGDVATWLAAAIYGDAPPAEEIAALRARIAERPALAAIVGPPPVPVERWDPRAWREVREVFRRHVETSDAFRAWAGLPPRGARACAGLVAPTGEDA